MPKHHKHHGATAGRTASGRIKKGHHLTKSGRVVKSSHKSHHKHHKHR